MAEPQLDNVATSGGSEATSSKRRRDEGEDGGKKKKSKKDKKDRSSKKKHKKHRDRDNNGDDDESGKKKKKKKKDRPAGSAYIDEAAELSGEGDDSDDDEEDEEDEEADEELKSFVVNEGDEEPLSSREAAEAAAMERRIREKEKQRKESRNALHDALRSNEGMGHAELDQHRDEMSMQKEMERLEKKYGKDDEDDEGIALDHLGEGVDDYEGAAAALAARPLPSIKDPKLWLLKCDPGTESECVFALMRKFNQKERSKDERLYIHSAFTTPGSKNYVYIEADKKIHVERAIRGIPALKWWSLKLVPIDEMVSAVTVKVQEVQVKPKQWVRMRRGIYQNDLAQVITSSDQGTNVSVRIIPRLDLAALAEEHRETLANDGKKKKKAKAAKKPTARPLARLFDKNEVTQVVGPQVVQRKKGANDESFFYYFNNKKFKNGFLHMTTNVKQLQTEDVLPTMDEIEKFQSRLNLDDEEAQDDDKKDEPLLPMESKATKFQKDDRVVVISGDLNHLTGRVMSIFKDVVTIMPDDKDLTDPLKFQTSELKKFFQVGDHVKVIDGKFKNETGLIVRVNQEDSTVVVFSDISSREMVVYAQDVVESTEVSTGRDSLGNFELHDMVSLNRDDRGVIVKIDIGSFRLLTNRNTIVNVRLQDIGKKMGSKFSSALDAQGNQISQDDVVRVTSGPNRDKQGVVKHLYRGTLFIFSKFISENSGMIVAQAKHCQLVGQHGVNKPQTPASPWHSGAGRGRAGVATGGPAPGASVGGARSHVAMRDPLLHATVRITLGPYKGCWGLVESVVENQVRVELASVMKTVSVPRTSVKPFENIKPGGHESDYTGAQTPLLGASRTPAWSDMGDRTPHHSGDGIGGMTPARSYGGMTPSHDVWNPKTPHHNPRTPQTNDNRDLDAEELGMDPTSFVRHREEHKPAPNPVPSSVSAVAASLGTGPVSSAAAAVLGHPTTPHTPYTPMPHTPHSVHTPTTPMVHTPAPHTPYTPTTPHTTPHTPHTHNAPHTPHTPMLGGDQAAAPFYAHMKVNIEGKESEGTIVRHERPDRWVVAVDGEGESTYTTTQLRAIRVTAPNSRVVVLSGERVGQYGRLIAMDGGDGIINLDTRDEDQEEDEGSNVVILPTEQFASAAEAAA